MTAKGNLMHHFRTLSSGTIAEMIGSVYYTAIDHAVSRAILYVAKMPEEECKKYQTFDQICNLFKLANGM